MIAWGGLTDAGCTNTGAAYCALCTWYPDEDADGHGDGEQPTLDECALPPGFSESAGDCDDASQDTHPRALEINDGIDNQYPSETGSGPIDELEGSAGFTDPSNEDAFCWEAQSGATEYEAVRSPSPIFDAACSSETTSLTCFIATARPDPGRAHHDLARAFAPHAGSWRARSDGTERSGLCE